MIKSVKNQSVEELIRKDANYYYVIPKYQRAYTWGPIQWKDLYDDFMENDFGYFFGSIICVNNSADAFGKQQLEVIDGQQRLTTVCMFLAAIYKKLKENQSLLDDDNLDELLSLRKSLLCSASVNGLILVPQVQGVNDKDFSQVMFESGIISKSSKEKNWGNRSIAKCYKYFLKRIESDMEENGVERTLETILEIKRKVEKAVLVTIEVASHSEAYMLFESLNNRGASLTPVDLMKNTILARAENQGMNSDECFDIWLELLQYLSDDYSTQERFFRQYYNAFKNEINASYRVEGSKKKDVLGNVATKSNLLSIYEALINRDLQGFLDEMIACGKIYSKFLLRDEEDNVFKTALTNLYRIQGAPGYLLLLYLFRKQTELSLEDGTLVKIIELLTKFFVRRNLTDIPNTRDLTRIFMDIISDIEESSIAGEDIYTNIYSTLKEKSVSDEIFKEKLSGDVYEDNVGVTRFILCALTEKHMTKETFVDLWDQNDYNGKKVYKWTIEHIFPEGERVPKDWVDMIAGGDTALANEYREKYVHRIGNLTVTGFNTELSNMSFEKKRDRKNSDGKYIGYKNGLEINKELAEKDVWTIEEIQSRTTRLVDEIAQMYTM